MHADVFKLRVGTDAWQFGDVTEDLLLDLIGVVAAVSRGVVVGIGNDIVTIAEIGDRRQILAAITRRLELALAVDRDAGGVVLADKRRRSYRCQ